MKKSTFALALLISTLPVKLSAQQTEDIQYEINRIPALKLWQQTSPLIWKACIAADGIMLDDYRFAKLSTHDRLLYVRDKIQKITNNPSELQKLIDQNETRLRLNEQKRKEQERLAAIERENQKVQAEIIKAQEQIKQTQIAQEAINEQKRQTQLMEEANRIERLKALY